MLVCHPLPQVFLVALLLFAPPAAAQLVKLGLAQGEAVQDVSAGLLTSIYKRAGLTVDITPLPATRINFMVLRNELDGEVARIGPYFEKNPTLLKVEPAYYHLVTTAFAHANRGIVVKSTEDLKKYRVGIIRGVYHAAIATEGVADVTVTDTVTQLFQMLAARRIDIAVDGSLNGRDAVRQLGLHDIKPVGDLARRDFFNVLIPSKANLTPRIRAAIKAMKASGELEKLTRTLEARRMSNAPRPGTGNS